MKANEGGKAPGMIDVLRHRTFRLLAIGVTASRVGDSMSFVVIAWLALGLGGPKAVGLVVFASGLVSALGAPVIGYLMDRLGLRLLMLVDNLSRGLLMVVLATLMATGYARLWHLVLIAVLSGILSPASEIAQGVAVPELLDSRELDAANRLLAASWDIAAWIGPAIAGVGIDLVGSASVLFVDASTFFLMAIIALAMPGRRAPEDEAPEEPGTAVGRLLSGFVLLWRMRPVAILTMLAVADLFLGAMMEVFLPAFNKLTLHQGAAAYGLMVSLAGAASLVGTLALTPFVSRLGYGPGLVLVLVARGLFVLPLAFVGSWGVAALFVALASVPDGSFFPIARTVQQRLIPASVRGRVAGARGALGIVGWPLGSAIGGLLVAGIGTRAVAVVMALGYLPLALVVLATPALMRSTASDAPVADPPPLPVYERSE